MLSVTQIISPWIDYSAVPPEVLEVAAERGTFIHRWCADHAMGKWRPYSRDYLIRGMQMSFADWFSRTVQMPLLVEHEVRCPVYQYIGHVDLVCTWKGEDFATLVELKTPSAPHKAWCLQLAGYWQALESSHRILNIPIGRAGSLRLDRDGGPALWDEMQKDRKPEYVNLFLQALNLQRYFEEK